MSCCVVSVLDNLRDAAIKLNMSEQMDTVQFYGLSEKEIALRIYQHYQDLEDEIKPCTLTEKRKLEQEIGNNKICRVEYKADDILSALLRLPNELFDHIVKYLFSEDKKNLRLVCKELYQKTTLLTPMFHDWCFEVTRDTLPDFILKSDKKFRVWVGKNGSYRNAYFINRFGHRISSLRIESSKFMMNYLEDMKPSEFPHLTKLDLEDTFFDNASLLMLAPQLQNLRLSYVVTDFDLSTVDDESKCFTKLKTLELEYYEIDVKKIMSKCSNSLEYLSLEPIKTSSNLQDFKMELLSLQCLHIVLETSDSHPSIRNLLSRCSSNLKEFTLYFTKLTNVQIDHQTLLDQTMKITTLDLDPRESRIENFLNKCPLVQNLTLNGYDLEVKDVVLKNLTYLQLNQCESPCMTSVLKQASLFSPRYVDIIQVGEILVNCEFPVCSFMDTVWVDAGHSTQEQTQVFEKDAFNKVATLFPKDAEVTWNTEPGSGAATFNRFYNIK